MLTTTGCVHYFLFSILSSNNDLLLLFLSPSFISARGFTHRPTFGTCLLDSHQTVSSLIPLPISNCILSRSLTRPPFRFPEHILSRISFTIFRNPESTKKGTFQITHAPELFGDCNSRISTKLLLKPHKSCAYRIYYKKIPLFNIVRCASIFGIDQIITCG